MSTLIQIVDGITARLRTIPALDQNVLNVVRRPATYPAVIVIPPTIPDYGLALDGLGGEFTIPLLVLVGVSEAEQQQTLFPYQDWAGTSSIPAAINGQRDLGLGDVDCRVVSAADPGVVELPDGTVAYGVTLNVLVFAS